MTEEDVLFRIKLERLQQKLTEKVTKDAKNVSDAEVEAYYNKNKKRFAQPERRDLLVVLTKTKAQAEKAKRALEDGKSWKQVVKQYSIDEASKAQGGKLPGVAKGQQEKALDDAIFAARKGEVRGPVKTQFGWQVFQVVKITPASQQSLDEAKSTIENLLRSQGQQKALDRFIKDFREQYKGDTKCADDFRVAECDNAPKQKTNTGQAPTGQQPQQPQQPRASSRRRKSHRTSAGPRGSLGRASAARRDHAAAAARVPLGPRAGRALDRAPHDRGGLRAGGRRSQRRRRQAAGRAGRRPLPGLFPGPPAGGARPG